MVVSRFANPRGHGGRRCQSPGADPITAAYVARPIGWRTGPTTKPAREPADAVPLPHASLSSRTMAISPCSSLSRSKARACRCRAKPRWSARDLRRHRFARHRSRRPSARRRRRSSATTPAIGFGATQALRSSIATGATSASTRGELKVAQYLFNGTAARSSSSAVSSRFCGRLRRFSPGSIISPWPRFLLFNALGGLVWATIFDAGSVSSRPRLRALRAPGRHRRADRRGDWRCARQPVHRSPRESHSRRGRGGDTPGPLVAPKRRWKSASPPRVFPEVIHSLSTRCPQPAPDL